MKRTLFTWALPLAMLGCTETIGSQDNNFSESDEALTVMALRALGADVDGTAERRCQQCHSVSRAKLNEWLELSHKAAESGCMPKSSRRYLYQPRVSEAVRRSVTAVNAESRAIEDHSEVVSQIEITDAGPLSKVAVSVDIRHGAKGDLTVSLQKDEGEPVVLHDRTGGDDDDLVETFERSDDFSGDARGIYKLIVSASGSGGSGELMRWQLDIEVVEPGQVDESLAALNPDYIDPATMTPGEAQAMVDCLRTEPGNPNSPFYAARAGIDTIRAHERNSHFRRLFRQAYGDSEEFQQQLGNLVKFMKMPRGSYFQDNIPEDADPSYTVSIRKEDFWAVREWFDRGMQNRTRWSEVLNDVLEEEAPPESCVPRVTEQLRDHVIKNARGGWTRKNAEVARIQSFGCPTAPEAGTSYHWPESSLACFPESQGYTEQTAWHTEYDGNAEGTRVVLLTALDYRTSFWTRSSADGRFFANGRSDGPGSFITDLKRKINIPVNASYDPGFGPDNSYFVFQGTPVGAGFCPQDMLLAPTENPDGTLKMIDFGEPGCSGSRGIRLYQHHGESVDGGISFTANGDYTSDNGGHSLNSTTNPGATAGPNAKVTITPIKPSQEADGGFEFLDAREYLTPFEGDTVISPTSRLISSRLSGGRDHIGMTVRLATLLEEQNNDFSVALSEPSTFCIQGGKSAHSFDDRYMVIHSYSEVDNVGKSDIYIVDLYDGETHQVTNMPAGQYALYPHFRSDGWLYFLVRDANPDPNLEYAGASDIALRIESAKPINDVSW